MILLAIDPGTRLGWAAFTDGILTACGPARFSEFRPPPHDHTIIERPTYYPGCPATRLAKLSEKVGALAAVCKGVEYVEPRTWKGQVPKAICHARAARKLSSAELSRINTRSLDAWDAIALGLWRLGR